MQKINASRFRHADNVRTPWQGIAEIGMSPESLLEPAVWGNVAVQHSLNPFDTIIVTAHDGSWWAELLVWEVGDRWATVEILRKHERPSAGLPTEVRADNPFEVKFRGPKKYSVLRKGDNAVMKEGFSKKVDAEAYMDTLFRQNAA